MANSLSGLVGLTVGLPCSQVGTLFASVALVRIPNSYPGGFFGDGAPEPSLDPACCGRSVPEAGPISRSACFSPQEPRSLVTRPSPGRVRPVLNSAVLRSGELGASRHETGLGEPPERDEQLAGERHDHHPADPPTGSRSALVEPLAERAIRLIAQPAPRHLDELCPDPCLTVAVDPLVALRVSARPRGWRHTDPARVQMGNLGLHHRPGHDRGRLWTPMLSPASGDLNRVNGAALLNANTRSGYYKRTIPLYLQEKFVIS